MVDLFLPRKSGFSQVVPILQVASEFGVRLDYLERGKGVFTIDGQCGCREEKILLLILIILIRAVHTLLISFEMLLVDLQYHSEVVLNKGE